MRQVQSQKQQLKLTPQQIQLMRLLQLPIAALEQSVKEEIERNPLLEVDGSAPAAEPLDNRDSDDISDWHSLMGDDDDDYAYRARQERDPNIRQREPLVTSEQSLSDNLVDQLNQLHISERHKSIGRVLIGSLDDSGYLSRDIGLIANDMAFRQGIETTPDEVEQVLHTVQSLEPAGIAARNLQECLSLQLHRMDLGLGPVRHAASIIDLCFNDFSHNKFEKIRLELGLSTSQLEAAINCIRRLNPKPGATESADPSDTQVVYPDVTVTREGDRIGYVVNDRHLPQLRISPYYAAMLQQFESAPRRNASDRETYKFLKDKSGDANAFITLLSQRHTTISALMDFFIAKQRKFFLTGDTNDMVPLKLADISKAIGMDISTVSRLLNSKYVQTEYGTLPLSDLCPSGFTTGSGDEVSIEAVRDRMTAIVEAEDPSHPLTDEAIAAELKAQGYPVARRTVAKYRELWGILPARLRRGIKALLLPLLMVAALGLQAQTSTTQSGTTKSSVSYYDSIIYRRIELAEKQPAATPVTTQPEATRTKKNRDRQPPDKTKPEAEKNVSQPAVDSAAIGLPSLLWYGTAFSDCRVKAEEIPLTSLPDEVILRLVKDSSEFCFPVRNTKSSPYGWRWERAHRGVDIQLHTGDPVSCAFDGVVRLAKPMGGYGNCIVIRHYNGLETVYGHLSKINVKRNQRVKAGDIIGLGGSTGRSTGPHLHFEVRFQYEPFDPEWILDFENFTLRTRRLHLNKTYFGISRPRKGENREYKADQSIIKERRRPTPPPTHDSSEF